MIIKLVTLNAGLLSCLGLEPAPYVSERFRALLNCLLRLEADVVCLQEVYGRQGAIIQAVREQFPYASAPPTRRWRFDSGLLVLSRYSLKANPFRIYTDAPFEEQMMDRGAQSMMVYPCPMRSFSLVHTHLVAGGLRHPESPRLEMMRARQIAQLLQVAREESSQCLLVGDMNCGPGVSEANYKMFAHAGFVDPVCVSPAVQSMPHFVTWDPANPLNAHGPHRRCPPQRIDHVFLHEDMLRDGEVTDVERVFQEPCVRSLQTGEDVTLSDHYGVRVTFRFRSGSRIG